MPEILQQNIALAIAALLVALALAWWLFHARRKTSVQLEERPDGETAPRRNQALIDAAPAAPAAPAVQPAAEVAAIEEVAPGELSAAANMNSTAAAGELADAEAGAPGSLREAMQQVPPRNAGAAPPAAGAGDAASDDLSRIKGLGPKLVVLLGEMGVTRFAQIAEWDDAEIDRVDARLGRFAGRIRRDDWVAQARLLAAGDDAGYEARFGRL